MCERTVSSVRMECLVLLLVLVLPVYTFRGPSRQADFAGTTLAYYPKYFDQDGFFLVELRVKTNGVSCNTPEWICASSVNCINYFTKTSYDIDPNSRAEFCQQEGVIIRHSRSTGPYLLQVWWGVYYGWAQPFTDSVSPYALALVDARNRSDTGQPNRSPQTTILPIFRVPWNCQRDIRLLTFDPDGDLVKCRYANNTIHELECNPCTPPSVLSLSPTCTLTFSPTDSSGVGWYAVQVMMEDFPRRDIVLTQNDGSQETKTSSNIISKIPVQFVLSVEAAAPSCTEGLYLPRFVSPTPQHGLLIHVNVSQTLQIYIKAEATASTITELVFSGPHDMTETSSAGQYTLSWTPSDAEDRQSYPVCFSVQAVLGETKFSSELRCVVVLVGKVALFTPPTAQTDMNRWFRCRPQSEVCSR